MPRSNNTDESQVVALNPVVHAITEALTPEIPLSIHLVLGTRSAAIIDAGLPQSRPRVDALVRVALEHDRPLFYACNTHAHHDHIGNLTHLATQYGARIVAAAGSREWMADPAANIQGFALHHPTIIGPTPELLSELKPTFDGPIEVDVLVDQSISLNLGGGVEIEAFRVDGHLSFELAWFETSTRTLILGDAITGTDWPFLHGHVDPAAYRATITRLRAFIDERGVELVAMSHYPAHSRKEFLFLLDRVETYLQTVQDAVEAQFLNEPVTLEAAWRGTCAALGKEPEFRALATVAAHIDELIAAGVLRASASETYVR